VSAAVAIVPPAGAVGAVGAENWRSNVCPVGLGGRLRYDIQRQIRQIRQIDGSLVPPVFVSWVSGHEVHQI